MNTKKEILKELEQKEMPQVHSGWAVDERFMKKLKIEKKAFSLIFGERGWIKGFDDKYRNLIITNEGVYFGGVLIAKGKLALVKIRNDR